ncbi:MAG: methyltransferase domain-containing protein [Verrucomicrobiales bacterium]|nr:methyltransferase domain-containing protein [Verrucomicrobiales bacterium]
MEATPLAPDADSSRTQFWVKRWERGKLPWDLGHVPPDLISFLDRHRAEPLDVLIPGCGSAYEVRAFHAAGHDVMAIDFSGPAVAHAREILGGLGDKVVQGNFFKHDFGDRRFGLVYERGFLCSLPPARWPEYVARISSLLAPGGLLMGLFLYGEEPEPPPYPLNDTLAAELLGPHFHLRTSQAAAADTVPVYQGMERWQEWLKGEAPDTTR